MSKFFNNSTAPTVCIKQETITLSDCLACSGCITSDDSELLKKDLRFLDERTTPTSFIISPHSKKNLYSFYKKVNFYDFEKSLIKYLKNTFNIKIIVDSSYFKKENKTGISSECPAVVLYVERVFPELVPILSIQKTFQQIASDYINDHIKDHPVGTSHRVVSIMQCYDKKDELPRDGTNIDHFIGTKDFYEFIKADFAPEQLNEYYLEPWEMTHAYINEEVTGLENCINILKKYKLSNTEPQNIEPQNTEPQNTESQNIELKICKGGCISGPAQISGTLNIDTPVETDLKIVYKTRNRIFKKTKKKTFNVEW